MLEGRSILAVVPARSGSKGIPDKNLRPLLGRSLIGWAGKCLAGLDWLDAAVISTDSQAYAEEGIRHGLAAPFLRPAELATDSAGAMETMLHALDESESHFGRTFDILLIIEPTSPLRQPQDLEGSTRELISSGADSVVTVSPLDPKWHPHKIFNLRDDRLEFFSPAGATVVNRQELEPLFWRNGVCYALTRACLKDKKRIITDNTRPWLMEREVVNIDHPLELEWAEALLKKREKETD